MKPKQAPLYNHLKIEKQWQKTWQDEKTYHTDKPGKKPKMYVLDMFPYPSGAGLHVGHPRGYIGSDVYARMQRMNGFNVLHPMGFDSFGLPAEQYAIQTKKHPGPFTDKLVAQYKQQLSIIGFSYDWDREVSTHRPEYYKWTQWIFLKLYDAWYDTKKNKARPIAELIAQFEKTGTKGVHAVTDTETTFTAKEWKAFSKLEQQDMLMHFRLAFEGFAEVNWCEELGTVLANDEIVDGPDGPVSERGGYKVIKKAMRQWFMRITAYADRLLKDLEPLDWPSNIKEIQKNWIGKSEGSEISFEVPAVQSSVSVFTTRADTLFGVTYIVLAPEYPFLSEWQNVITNWKEVQEYIKSVAQKDETERTSADKPKTGIQLKGITAINPANGEEVPVWIADYVLANYGTGAVMGVPQHDERDHIFATTYKLPIIDQPLVDKIAITKSVNGTIVTKYKMRDAIFARQRYWGEPIPLRHAVNGIITPLKEKELPLQLPNVKSYEPSGNGESPLAGVKAWVKEGYETNTMPGWAASSWYFLRYMDPANAKAFAGEKNIEYWKDVDMYVGGAEHATGHLLYSRFWHKFLYDMGYVPTKEPFKALRNQGMIGGADGRKMSKRWGNVINPDEVVKLYGADSLRLFEMFLGPFESHLPWSTEGIIGSRRFIERVWRLSEKVTDGKSDKSAEKLLHKTIKKVTEDIQKFAFNTAVSSLMICLNEFEKSQVGEKDFCMFLQLLAPFAPHVTEELWKQYDHTASIHTSTWPKHKPALLVDDEVTIGIQVNGKVRGEITVGIGASKEEIEEAALAVPRIQEFLKGMAIKKVIVVPGRVINIVAA
ncbi:MAG: Leucyl-tRNA synthetase [Candidatus Nomurabacteria bacterium]|nr:Leucyl-tRNA synthetase [Candidatus Nomurabacteria bacterium]